MTNAKSDINKYGSRRIQMKKKIENIKMDQAACRQPPGLVLNAPCPWPSPATTFLPWPSLRLLCAVRRVLETPPAAAIFKQRPHSPAPLQNAKKLRVWLWKRLQQVFCFQRTNPFI